MLNSGFKKVSCGWRFSLLCLLVGIVGCSRVFFYPMSDWVQTPSDQDLEYQDVFISHDNDGARLHGWWLPAQTDRAMGTVYFLHGNAQNVSTHLMNVYWLPSQGYNVFLLDYQGFGRSEGRARLPDVFEDVQAGLEWLHKKDNLERPLIVFGQSLGASLLPYVLSRSENRELYDCVIMEAGFAGFRDIARDAMRRSFLLWPASFVFPYFISDDREAKDHIAGMSPAPLLILHSSDDRVVPFDHGERLFELAEEPKYFRQVPGEHLSAMGDVAVRKEMLEFSGRECAIGSDAGPGVPQSSQKRALRPSANEMTSVSIDDPKVSE